MRNEQFWGAVRRAAYHEAGHAVVGALLDVPFTCVFLGGIEGGSTIASSEDLSAALRQLDMIVAGNVAESILIDSEVEPLDDGAPVGDFAAAVETLRAVHLPSEVRDVHAQAWERFEGVRSLLTKYWPAVEAVASRLVSGKRLMGVELTYQQVKALVERSGVTDTNPDTNPGASADESSNLLSHNERP